MASPSITTQEFDLSQRVPDYPGMYGLIIGNFDKGPVGDRTFITSPKQADIVISKPSPGSDVAYHILHSFLTKSSKCWIYRIVDSALYGGIIVGSSFNEEIGIGDGSTLTFNGILPMERCHPETVSVWIDETKVAYDNGTGDLLGLLLNSSATNTVDYTTGEVTVTFNTATPNNAKVYIRWGYESYAFTEGMADPSTYEFDDNILTQEILFSGSIYTDTLVPFPLVEPEDTVTGLAEATLIIYDGDVAIAYASELGILVDIGTYLDGTATNTVNYANGELEFTLDSGYTPANTISVSYGSRSAYSFVVYADNPGVWSDLFQITISNADPINYKWDIKVEEYLGDRLPNIVQIDTVSKELKKDGFGRQMNMEEKINGNSYYIRIKDNPYLDPEDELLPDYLRYVLPAESVSHNDVTMDYEPMIMAGGFKGYAPNLADYIKALKTFNNKEDVKIDIVMDTVNHPTFQIEMIKLCDRDFGGRGDCYAVMNVPFEYEMSNNYISDTVDYRKYILNISSSFAGLYFGHVKIFDDYNGREIYIPPSGFVGAAFSYSADQYRPWFAAAGWRRGKLPILDLYRRVNLGERDILYDNDINAMKFKPGRGIAIWGQKTLYGVASALDRANVRWLLIVVENAIEEFLEDYEFEFNDAYTRALIHAAIHSYLAQIKAERGLYAFEVVCNETNNPPAIIDSNKMNVDFYLQPVKVAEFIFSRAIITRTGVNFGEVRIT